MRKIFIIAILAILDIYLYVYLNNLVLNRNIYELKLKEDNIIYQTSDIVLNDINEFKINNYFKFIGNNNYKYEFKDDVLYICIDNKKYSFSYKINEPEVIEKIVYKEKEIYNDNNNQINEYEQPDYFYVNNDYLFFNLNEDLEIIRTKLINNLNTTVQASIDYSQLNVSQIGQYSVFYVTNDTKIEIIVEIG